MTDIDRWILSYQGRVVNIWYNDDYTVYGVNPNAGGQSPDDSNIVTVESLGNGVVALRSNPVSDASNISCYASVRDDYYYRVQFQGFGGNWITGAGANERLRLVPTGDGYFALFSDTFHNFLIVDGISPKAGNSNVLLAVTGDVNRAARFTATPLNQGRDLPTDLLDASDSASGLSFAGVNLAGRTLSGDLSLCDFRQASLHGCVMDGAVLRKAIFAGQHLASLSIAGADCTGADFTGCDFSSFNPGGSPPVLTDAILTGAVIPAGISWSGAKLSGAVLAGANLTGANLSGTASAPTDLSRAVVSGTGGPAFTPFFTPAYQGGGIGGYDLRSSADRVIAYDGDASYLVCYRPGRGAAAVVHPQGTGFAHVLLSGDPGPGLGGYNLADPADQVIAWDFGNGSLDHLVCYRPGQGLLSVLEKTTDANNNVTFVSVFSSANGVGDADLSQPVDRIIAYDYLGNGRLDHLLCYRPGTGKLWILQKTVDANKQVGFSIVGQSDTGLGSYDLKSPGDRIIAYDYESSGQPSYLLCYRPGTGAVTIAQYQGDNTFSNVYLQADPGSGIGGFSLLNPFDQIIAFDHVGNGHLDHLACYRPGAGVITILKRVSAENDPSAFSSVFWQRFGVGGYDLAAAADQVIAYDYTGAGHLDHLVCYRPGTGTIWVIQPRGPQATLNQCDLAGASLAGACLAGADLTATATLAGANLSGTGLAGTKLSGVHLEGADLSGAHLRGAMLTGAHLNEAVLAGTDFTGLDLTTVNFSTPLKRSADLSKPTVFTGCTLPYAVIGLDWTNLDLTSATVNGLPTDLTGLTAVGVHWTEGHFEGCVLDGADFSHAVLTKANFTGATVKNQPASFSSAMMPGAYFTGAVLKQVNFSSATLGGQPSVGNAVFSTAYLANCTFTEANLFGVDFSSATLDTGNVLKGSADLEEANFAGAYLPAADFTGANLQGAAFDGAFMIQVVLAGANLSPSEDGAKATSLTGALLQEAVLTDVKLYGANLADAVITDKMGSVSERHYGDDGELTQAAVFRYRGGLYPSGTAFSDSTICPNRETYQYNTRQGYTIRQMMQTPDPPPAEWSPKEALPGVPRARAVPEGAKPPRHPGATEAGNG